MRKLNLREQLPVIYVLLSSLLALVFDSLKFYSSIDIQSWNYIHEFFVFVNLIVFYFYLRQRPILKKAEVKTIIKNFSVLLVALYIFILLNRQFFSTDFSGASFPVQADNISSVLYSNSVSLAAVFFFLPMLMLIRNLISYKYKKRTNFYLVASVVLSVFLMIWTTIFKKAPDFVFDYDFSDLNSMATFVTNVVFVITLLSFFMLSLRTSWVTHLRQKEKTSFFILSAVLAWLIIYLFDFAFAEAVPAHSIVLGMFTNLSWLFLTFYSIMAGLNLMMHLPTARVFDRKMSEISSLHDLSRAISVDSDFRSIVSLVVEMSCDVLNAQFTWLEVFNIETQKAEVVASQNLSKQEIKALTERANQTLTNKIYTEKKAVVINEFIKHGSYEKIQDWKKEIGSIAGIPVLSADGDLYGIFYAAKNTDHGFDPDDVNLLEAYATQASIAFENAVLIKKSLERERMEQELQIAREVQLRLLPQSTPDSKQLDIETLTITAYEVGGDYYDFYNHSDDGMGLIIGDVSGKGTSAAFYMAETKGIIQSLAQNFSSPSAILKQTNKILYPSMERKSFISLLAARWDAQTKVLHFSRAGHCPIIHYSADQKKTVQLQPAGMAIGLDSGPIFDKILEEANYKTASGDILAFYTDGLSEARNKSEEEFGEKRLSQIIRENAELGMPELKQVIIDNILSFLDGQALHDDLTLILIRVQ